MKKLNPFLFFLILIVYGIVLMFLFSGVNVLLEPSSYDDSSNFYAIKTSRDLSSFAKQTGVVINKKYNTEILSAINDIESGKIALSGSGVGCRADFTGDGIVDSADLAQLLGAWGVCTSTEFSCMDSCDNDEDNLIDCEDIIDCNTGTSCPNEGTCMFGACVVCGDGVCSSGETFQSCLVDCFDCIPNTKLLASDGAAGDVFGSAVDIEQEWAFVGAPNDDDLGSNSGSVYVYKSNSGAWQYQQKLTALGAGNPPDDKFGTSVSIFGDFVVIGAEGGIGAAYVFRLNEQGQWIQEQQLLASDGFNGDNFGSSASISDNVIVIGATLDDNPLTNSGSAYVFRYYSTSSTPCGTGPKWCEEQKLIASDSAAYDYFGRSVAVSGNVIIVSTSSDDVGTGSAYVFRYYSTSSTPCGTGPKWCQDEKLTASDGFIYDYFGFSVDMFEEDKVIVGAYNSGSSHDGSGSGEGAVYIYTYDGNSWGNETKIMASDAAPGDWFGWSVSITNGKIIVGSPRDGPVGNLTGAVYIYTQNGPDLIEQKILASDGQASDYFGSAVAISASNALAGAKDDDDNGASSGSAYMLDCPSA